MHVSPEIKATVLFEESEISYRTETSGTETSSFIYKRPTGRWGSYRFLEGASVSTPPLTVFNTIEAKLIGRALVLSIIFVCGRKKKIEA